MAIVGVRIGGREYHLACDDGQEEHLRLLADDVDDRVRDLVSRMGGNTGEVMGFLLAAITMADEIIENKREVERLSSEVRQLIAIVDNGGQLVDVYNEGNIEDTVAITLEEIAQRIETMSKTIKISDR